MKASAHINPENGLACLSFGKGYLSDSLISPVMPQDPTDQIIGEMDQGIMIGNNGHGSMQHSAHGNIVFTDDIPHLSNGQRLPVMVILTYLNGYFAMPMARDLWQKKRFCRMGPWPPSPQETYPVPGPDNF